MSTLNRKEELAILIEAQQKIVDAFHEKRRKAYEKTDVLFIKLFENLVSKNIGESVKGLIQVNFSTDYVKPMLKGCRWEDIVDIRQNRDWVKNKPTISYSLGYGSSGISQKDNRLNFIKMRILGEICMELSDFDKTGEGLFKDISDILKSLTDVDKDRFDITNPLDNLKRELRDIERNLVIDKVIKDGSAEFPLGIQRYINNRDVRQTLVSKIVIGKITDKTITITFFDKDRGEVDTLRMKIEKAKNLIHSLVQTSKKSQEDFLEKVLDKCK